MTGNTRSLGMAIFAAALAAMLTGAASTAAADQLPPLWGYGIKSCEQLLGAAEGDADGGGQSGAEYGRYADWLTGFVSGLNLATGSDVLRGADMDTALRRIRAYCGGHPKDNFFAATMDLVRMLSGLR